MAEQPIPLRNIWLLFLYAADLVQMRQELQREVEAAKDLPDLLGRLLAQAVETRIRRNLTRNYRSRKAELFRVRGRIDLLSTETGQLMERGQVACRFHEHTMNTPRNRLVRIALDRLATRVSDEGTAHRCRGLAADFSRAGVTGSRPARNEMAGDQIGRNETTDRLMVALAGLVFETMIPTESEGTAIVPGAEATEHLIRRLFERAIGNALRLELEPLGWQVHQGQRLSWPIAAATPGLPAILPGMQTDIELNQPETGRRVVIDTKFTNIFTSSNYRDSMLKSGYLYQLYTYLRTQECTDDPASFATEGMLLHPQVGDTVEESMRIQGHKLSFRTIDLSASPRAFEAEIRRLAVTTRACSLTVQAPSVEPIC
jgi:5-methylcytosine-specific restriction enzyme subunit McrC